MNNSNIAFLRALRALMEEHNRAFEIDYIYSREVDRYVLDFDIAEVGAGNWCAVAGADRNLFIPNMTFDVKAISQLIKELEK